MAECGECRACCTLLPVEAINKPINTRCKHVCEAGCAIYDARPQTCAEFECGYLQGENIPESLRPDKCGIIFIKRTDRIFSGALMPDIKTTDLAKGQIDSFQKQGFSVVLISLNEKKPLLMLADGHDSDEVMTEYKEALNGNL